jgi:hypothetical protein
MKRLSAVMNVRFAPDALVLGMLNARIVAMSFCSDRSE